MPTVITREEFVQLFKPGTKAFVQGCTAEPTTLIESLRAAPEQCAGVEFLGVPLPGYNRFDPTSWHDDARMTTFFMTPELRRSAGAERIRFIPMHYSYIYRHLREMPDLDFLLFQGAAGDRDGLGSYGLSSEHAPGALESAKTVIMEMNSSVPYTRCHPPLPMDKVDYIVETDRAPLEFPSPELGEQAERIGAHAASVIRDGDTLQIGIGRLQSAAMQALTSHRDLGFHSGLISDDTLALIECGAMNGSRKNRDHGIHVAGAVFGSKPLHEFATDQSLSVAGVEYTHEIPVIASIDNFVSINACMQVDLHGQVVADHIHRRQISAPGGYGDFQRGARLSNGGRSIVLLAAASADGTKSNIVPAFPADSVITGLRADTDFIVTDYGVADLRHKDTDQKAQALIAVAAPDFREELSKAWRERA